jgi:hypothetical protein
MKSTVLSLLLLTVLAVPVGGDDKKPDDKKDKQPAPKLTLGKDTTYVVGPLDKQGYIDYEAALNAELSRGVTNENNANALLWQVFGPRPEGSEMPAGFFKWLDIPEPPKDGLYFMDIGKYTRERLALNQNQMDAVYEQQGQATQRPWSAKDFTVIAEWLKFNEKPLAMAIEATKRTEYFNPLVSRKSEDEPGALIGALLPSVQKCRELASAFTARAMLRLNEGDREGAWQDLLACHRLGRLVGRGATLIESLVGIAICAIASNSTLGYIDNANLTSKQALACLKDLQAMPALRPMTESINLGERFMGLDSMQLIRRGNIKNLEGLADGVVLVPNSDDLKLILEKFDWDSALRRMNQGYDRITEAMRVKDRAGREEAFDKLDKELIARQKAISDPATIAELIKKAKNPTKETAKEVAEALSDILMALLSPAVRKVQGAHDRAHQIDQNLQVAFAMAAYKADNGKYPAKLDDLAPKYLAKVPGDVFSGKPLIYKPTEKGYLFYSVGQNGKDDEGRWYDDEPRGDDPRVKMPLPPLKKQ